jgi:ParB-like chromosome segregation protein Spo0J
MKDYFNSKTVDLKRSQINPASYNPRTISEEGRKQLKRSIKRYGVVGGIVVNEATGYTIVGGHQKVSVLDELNKYNSETHDNDYTLRVEVISVDEKTEKSLNIALNNQNIGGEWDADKLRELIPDIDYKDAGFTEADLDIIGCDFLLQTEGENQLAKSLDDISSESEKERKVKHMKDVKKKVRESTQNIADDMDAYVMLSFDTYEAKAEFMERFEYNADEKIIKGEVFGDKIERVD